MFQEEVNYQALDLALSERPIVTEFFSFYSPHANSFEPIIFQVKKQLPKGVIFQKIHVSSMGGTMGISMSKAYATMVALGIEDMMTPVMFNHIHTLRKPPNNDEELRQIFLDQGVDGKNFDATFNGFAVNSMIPHFDTQFQAAGLQDIPAVTVNDKYLIKPQGLESIDQYVALVNYLLTLK